MSNKLYQGAQEVKAVYRGLSPVKAIYRGHTLLWETVSNWFAPVQTGSNLYIKSVYSATQDGSNLRIK